MLTLHHLAYSRSQRVLWLLEESGIPHELVVYPRDAKFKAPPELARVHPLGKSPVIVDGDLTLAESATILRYLHDRHGEGRLTPPPGTKESVEHEAWLDHVESTAVLPVMILWLGVRTGTLPDGFKAYAEPVIARVFGHLAKSLGERTFLMGERLTLADIQWSYVLAMAERAKLLVPYPTLGAYLDRLMHQPAFLRAAERGGPMLPPAS